MAKRELSNDVRKNFEKFRHQSGSKWVSLREENTIAVSRYSLLLNLKLALPFSTILS
jgi:histidyl-tRNA synthetase